MAKEKKSNIKPEDRGKPIVEVKVGEREIKSHPLTITEHPLVVEYEFGIDNGEDGNERRFASATSEVMDGHYVLTIKHSYHDGSVGQDLIGVEDIYSKGDLIKDDSLSRVKSRLVKALEKSALNFYL